jgi:hypothetical protein
MLRAEEHVKRGGIRGGRVGKEKKRARRDDREESMGRAHGITTRVTECHKSVTRVLRECHESVTRVLQGYYRDVRSSTFAMLSR